MPGEGRRWLKILRFNGFFHGLIPCGRCGHRRLASGARVVYCSAMPVRRIARKCLSLLVAYAIVLLGVLGPALGHGFDPSAQLCSYGATTGQASDVPDAERSQDCCPALCGNQPVLPHVPAIERVLAYSRVVHAPFEWRVEKSETASIRSARAPPLG